MAAVLLFGSGMNDTHHEKTSVVSTTPLFPYTKY
jgi:hypothetical protein